MPSPGPITAPVYFDFVDLRLFVNVAQSASLTSGASSSALSLAAASTRIKNLESALGAQLLYRTRRGVSLTPAGDTLLQHARLMLSQVQHTSGPTCSSSPAVRMATCASSPTPPPWPNSCRRRWASSWPTTLAWTSTCANIRAPRSSEQQASGNVAYGVSKAGVHAMTAYLAKELAGASITVNAVAPGPVASRMTTDLSPAIRALIPVGRMGTPEDVAAAVAFLASDAAGFITGEVIDANAGDVV